MNGQRTRSTRSTRRKSFFRGNSPRDQSISSRELFPLKMQFLFFFVLFVCFVVASSSSEAQSKFDFSIKNIMRGPELYGRPPSDIHWSADSKWIYFNWVEAGTDWREQPKRFRVRGVPGAKPERVLPPHVDFSRVFRIDA